MACAIQEQIGKYATLRGMINWRIEKPNQGERIESDSDAMKALRATCTGRTAAACSIRVGTERLPLGS